jgi:hypothetical protein
MWLKRMMLLGCSLITLLPALQPAVLLLLLVGW